MLSASSGQGHRIAALSLSGRGFGYLTARFRPAIFIKMRLWFSLFVKKAPLIIHIIKKAPLLHNLISKIPFFTHSTFNNFNQSTAP